MGMPFHGGIHPKVTGAFDIEKPAETLPAPDILYYPLIQHRGAAAEPLVKVGEQVCLGQKIADSPAGLTSPVHASVSGMVRAIEPWDHPDGGKCDTIVVENDRLDRKDPALEAEPRDVELLDEQQIVEIAREAGIVGMGGAGFPLYAKLKDAAGQVETVILNGCECEPLLQSDHTTMIYEADSVVQGGLLLARAVDAPRILIAVEDDKPRAAQALQQAAAPYDNVEVRVLPVRYPQGGEKMLIKALLGKEVPPGKLPIALGLVVSNVESAAALYRACRSHLPLISRNVTVAGSVVARPGVLSVRLGTPFEALMEHCGLTAPYAKLLSGGPMMGKAQHTAKVPVIKTVSGLVLRSEREARSQRSTNCIRCGKCMQACPMLLSPCYLNFYSDLGNLAELERLNIDNCIECGVCSYSCPAKLPLVQKFRLSKLELSKQRRAAKERKEGGKPQ